MESNMKNNANAQEAQNNQNAQVLPPQRIVTAWDGEDYIKVKGVEWQIINDAFTMMSQAIQAIASRNIIDGVIKFNYEKLNPETLQYEPMNDEEKVPYEENMKVQIEKMKSSFKG